MKEQPPTAVPSIQVGTMPRYSATSFGLGRALATPSIMLLSMPASSSALRAALAWSCSIDMSGMTPRPSVSAAPIIATMLCKSTAMALRSSPACRLELRQGDVVGDVVPGDLDRHAGGQILG